MAHAGGRPMKFKTNVELVKKIDAYFAKCDKDKSPYTVAGLALFLDVDTDTVRNYEKRDEFFGTIKRAKQKIEESLEVKLHGNNVTGIIFNLKNNYGWTDRQDFTSKGESVNVNIVSYKDANSDNSIQL